MKPTLIVALAVPLLLASDLDTAGRLGEPDYLPQLARQILKKKMRRHGQDMTQLFISTTLLQREKTRTIATELSKEVRLSRPTIGGEDELNSALPEKFFVLQDEVRARARNLAEAARAANDAEMAKSFGLLMQTCVECHSAFLKRE